MHDVRHQDNISLDLNNLKVISVLGRGAKGVVFLVQTETSELLAVKVILRSSIENKKKKKSDGEEYRRISFEREVLRNFHHPLLPKLHGVLKTDKVVGYAIDYCSGRDLNVLRKNQTEKMFSTDIIRFYAAELVLALEYLHGLGIVYRDLKPENVLIQENGHLMLVDFDLSTKLAAAKSPETRETPRTKPQITPKKKKNKFALLFNRRDSGISPEYSPQPAADPLADASNSESDSVEKSNSFVGTEEYVAPEIVLGDGHDFAVDLWCLGVMLYEMLYGTTPFRGPARKDTFYRIVNKAPDLTGEATPLRDLIRKLLEKDPNKRITIREIKGHDYFKAVDWDFILEMPRPPFIPDLTDVGDMDGNNKEIDVESYAQGVFKVDEGEKTNKYFEGDQNKDSWANLIHNDHFLIF